MNAGDFEKFQLTESESDALEAAIELLMLKDARRAYDRAQDRSGSKAERDYESRLEALFARRNSARKSGIVAPNTMAVVVSRMSPTAPHWYDVESAFRTIILEHAANSWPLQQAIIKQEVMTAEPFAVADMKAPPSPSATSREEILALLDEAFGRTPHQVVSSEAVADGLVAARAEYSDVWGRIAATAATVLLSVLGGFFGAPVIGGLIGTWFLGLSGAAAVSAGLALLGGGAVAAGGFGMAGGTVVVAAAAGAGGGGLGNLFLGENGEDAARLAAVKTMGLFAALRFAGLLDRQLAEDLRHSLEQQHGLYQRRLAKDDRFAILNPKKAALEKVVRTFKTATDVTKKWHGDATSEREILQDPVAWKHARSQQTTGHAGIDAVLREFTLQTELLESALHWLQAEEVASVTLSTGQRFAAVFKRLSPSARAALNRGGSNLGAAREEVLAIATSASRAMHALQLVANDLDGLAQQNAQLQEQVERATRLSSRLLVALAERTDEVAATRDALDAATSVVKYFLGTSSGARRRGARLLPGTAPGDAEQPPSDQLEMQPAADVMQRALAALGFPLGQPLDVVRKRYRERVKELHPDAVGELPPAVQRVTNEQLYLLDVGRKLHEAVHAAAAEAMT